ncbi:MAG: Rap1a/Tai family immunity protein, partial [Candidatus Acidiferrales bacterium]
RDVDNDTSADKPPVKSFDVGFCFGFIDGANSAHQVWAASDKTNHRNHAMSYCFPDSVTNGQMLRVFVKYLDEHPQDLHEPAALLYIEAMRRAFPCGK